MQYLITTKQSKVKAIVDNIAPIPLPGLDIKELRTVEDYIMCLDVQDRIKVQNNITERHKKNTLNYKLFEFNIEVQSMHSTLMRLFIFDDTKEGHEYWMMLCSDPFKASSFWD